MAHLSTSQYQKSQSIPYCKSINTSKHTPELYSHQKDVNLLCVVVFYLFLDIVCLSFIRCIFCRCFSGFMCHIKMKLLLHQILKRSVPSTLVNIIHTLNYILHPTSANVWNLDKNITHPCSFLVSSFLPRLLI